MKLKFIFLNAFFVSFSLTVKTYTIEEDNFQNLFESVANLDLKKGQNYRNILKKDAAKKQQAFDTMMKDLWTAKRNAVDRKYLHTKIYIDQDATVNKREVHKKEDIKTRMEGAIISMSAKLNGLRTGRASPSLLEPVKVNVYGAQMSINQLGTISVPESGQIQIQVWDQSQIVEIVKAITNAGLGLNPSNDGNIIRVPVPPLTEERRKEFTKKASEYGENGRIAIRNLRRDAIDAIKKRAKDKELSEDETRQETEKMKKVADGYIQQIDEIVARKSKEIMSD